MKKTLAALFCLISIQKVSSQELSKGFVLWAEGAAIHGREINAGTNFGYILVKGACVALAKTDDVECNPTLVNGWYHTGWKGSVDHKGFVKT